ncbi:hypothetical protein J2T56_003196 [Natronobacillus azotifigens]|uniref:Uncharacterized protein n=1 Tax=Natronobacillus azotifigens TaxID=472978 RepID=A0A9J6RGP5_9BACI|nr:hypothetical protein [Natronobacillus azotifigens]MCZ0704605.1 hypothetical protein [Natronobacillus azotifigens]
MNRIDNNSPSGTYLITTRSGSKYFLEISEATKKLVRVNPKFGLRKDGEQIEVKEIMTLEIGKPAIICIEPLGLGSETFRLTTEVLDIIFFV